MVAQAKLISSLGLAMRERGDFIRALKLQQSAFELDPDNFQIQINLGVAHQDLNQIEIATQVFKSAVEMADLVNEEGHLMAQLNYCMAALRLKPSFELFKAFLVRWEVKRWPQQPYKTPLVHWLKQDSLNFERLLVLSDQGHGDNMMSLPAIAWLAQKAPGKITVLVKEHLLNLYKVALSSFDVKVTDQFEGSASGWLTGLDILGVFSNSLAHYEDARKKIESNLQIHFHAQQRKCIPPNSVVIALCWRGNPDYALDRWRALPMQDLMNAAKASGKPVHLLPLHIDLHENEIRALNQVGMPWRQPAGDFLETAMLILQAQSVWSADSACTHLAGLCGVPTWVGVSLPGDWRWPVQSGLSHWYPQVQVYRQSELQNWSPFVHIFRKWLREIKV